jgi:hypothetical protein
VAATAALVGLSVGGYGLYAQRARGEEFDAYPSGSPVKTCSLKAPDRGGPACRSLYDKEQAARKLMIGGFAAGGALAVGAIVGFVVSAGDPGARHEAGRSSPVALSVQSPGGGEARVQLGWTGRF